MKRTVIFDVGRVLIEWDIRAVYRGEMSEAEIDEFLEATDWHAWNLELDRGGGWDQAVARLSAAHPEYRAQIEASHHRWHEAVPDAIHGSVDILAELIAADTPLYAITNFSVEKWMETKARFGFLQTSFRDVIVSGEEGLVKPQEAIFQLCLTRNGLRAEDCVFIDDSPANIATANRLGMDGILFCDAAALRQSLCARGLNIGT